VAVLDPPECQRLSHPAYAASLVTRALTMAGKMTDLDIKQSEKGENRDARFETECGQSGRGVVDAGLHDQIEALIPRLTRYARALTRDAVTADDCSPVGSLDAQGGRQIRIAFRVTRRI
jgi:hypothetical protein